MVPFLYLVDRDHAASWADILLNEHGSLAAILRADPDALRRIVPAEIVQALLTLDTAVVEVLHRRVCKGAVLSNWQQVTDYLHAVMAHRLNESARVLHLNSKNVLIRDEQVSEGSIDQTAIYVREVARRALELGSAAVILVHNHPSGDPSPSNADVALTRAMVLALQPLGVRMHDHLIVSSTGHVSLRALGLM